MAEPTSSGAGAMLGWKLLGGAAGIAASGIALASFVVILMTWPKTLRELAVALISTVSSSLGVGAGVILYFDLARLTVGVTDLQLFVAIVAMGGLLFICGLPGWLLVRAAFRWMERRRDSDIAELAEDFADGVRGVIRGGDRA